MSITDDVDMEPEIDDTDTDSDQDEPTIHVTTAISETDGTHHSATVTLHGDCSNPELADALISTLRAVAALRGAGLAAHIDSRLRDTGSTP